MNLAKIAYAFADAFGDFEKKHQHVFDSKESLEPYLSEYEKKRDHYNDTKEEYASNYVPGILAGLAGSAVMAAKGKNNIPSLAVGAGVGVGTHYLYNGPRMIAGYKPISEANKTYRAYREQVENRRKELGITSDEFSHDLDNLKDYVYDADVPLSVIWERENKMNDMLKRVPDIYYT